MSTETVIIGSGAHARVVYDILLAAGEAESVTVFVDVEGKGLAGGSLAGKPVLPGLAELEDYMKNHDVAAVLGHGNNSRRKALMGWLDDRGAKTRSAIHPRTVISPEVEIGTCTTVSAGAIILTGSRIGRGVIVNTAATVDHDCVVGDFVQLAPGSHLAGRVTVNDEAFVGIGAVVIQNLTVGRACVIGAGAAVVRDAPEETLVIGVPARVRRQRYAASCALYGYSRGCDPRDDCLTSRPLQCSHAEGGLPHARLRELGPWTPLPRELACRSASWATSPGPRYRSALSGFTCGARILEGAPCSNGIPLECAGH